MRALDAAPAAALALLAGAFVGAGAPDASAAWLAWLAAALVAAGALAAALAQPARAQVAGLAALALGLALAPSPAPLAAFASAGCALAALAWPRLEDRALALLAGGLAAALGAGVLLGLPALLPAAADLRSPLFPLLVGALLALAAFALASLRARRDADAALPDAGGEPPA